MSDIALAPRRLRFRCMLVPQPEIPADLLTAARRCAEVAAEQERANLRNLEALTSVVRQVLSRPSAEVKRVCSVDSRMIYVVDGALSEPEWGDLYMFLSRAPFRRTNFAKASDQEFKHFLCEHSVEEAASTAVFRAVTLLANVLFTEHLPLVCQRVYTNSRQFGDVSFVHRDSNDSGAVTALVYPNPEWNPELGGETVFYDERGTVVESCEPMPGRIVIFNGSVWHKGSPPGRLLVGPRFTTAFKMEHKRGELEENPEGSVECKNFDLESRKGGDSAKAAALLEGTERVSGAPP